MNMMDVSALARRLFAEQGGKAIAEAARKADRFHEASQ